jgi:uncharacterized membrane protein YjfL (UPF0719 family)
MTHALDALVFLGVSFVLAWVGKFAYGVFHPGARVDRELTARDNVAFALALGGYYFGILIVVGAPLSSPSRGPLWWDALSVAGWGLLAIVLLNLASLASRRVLFGGLDLTAEIVDRGNASAGIVLAGSHVANALLILGALSDEGGLLPAAVFWLYAQILLEAAAFVFTKTIGHEVAREIVRDNRAAALVVAGVLVAMGNVLRMSITGPFEGWGPGFVASTGYAIAGLVLLFVVRWLTDWMLLPGVTLRQEVLEQEVPNVGVGYLEAIFYIGGSLLIGWSL